MKKGTTAAYILFLSLLGTASPVRAIDMDKKFFHLVEGQWSGPGEIVAGKYKGTKFTCTLAGMTSDSKVGMILDGTCRVGIFSQSMKATVTRSGTTYTGIFNDGASGNGLDITSGTVNNERGIFGLNRKQLNGVMLTSIRDKNTMNVTVSVHASKGLIPVIGMNLKRVGGIDELKIGSIIQN